MDMSNNFHNAACSSVAKWSSCRRLYIAGLARTIQMRLPYLHRCSPIYCLKDRPCCRFFYPWPYDIAHTRTHTTHTIRRNASFLLGSRLPPWAYYGRVMDAAVYVAIARNIIGSARGPCRCTKSQNDKGSSYTC